MGPFGHAAILGLFLGFVWGTACSIPVLYSIYLGGYRKAVEDSLAQEKPKRFQRMLGKIETRRAQKSGLVRK